MELRKEWRSNIEERKETDEDMEFCGERRKNIKEKEVNREN